jgi:nucleotide-binding universal stress UspA family protein
MRRVLAAIDTSPCAGEVLEVARAVGEFFDAGVAALHVREDGRELVLAAARDAGVELLERDGPPIDAIVAAAGDPDVVAVVLGARGVHSGPRPAGRTALDVITRLAKPVVVVPPDGAVRVRISRVLVPLEGSLESSEAVAGTIARAGHRDVEILVLHVYGPETMPAFEDQPQHAVPAWADEFLARFVAVPSAHVEVVRHVGVAGDRVVAVAQEVGADLIALGWSQELAPGRAQIVRETLARSSVPVLLVPAAA